MYTERSLFLWIASQLEYLEDVSEETLYEKTWHLLKDFEMQDPLPQKNCVIVSARSSSSLQMIRIKPIASLTGHVAGSTGKQRRVTLL